jgi:hypothetical protein
MKADKKWVIEVYKCGLPKYLDPENQIGDDPYFFESEELALETAKASGWEKYYISKIEVPDKKCNK